MPETIVLHVILTVVIAAALALAGALLWLWLERAPYARARRPHVPTPSVIWALCGSVTVLCVVFALLMSWVAWRVLGDPAAVRLGALVPLTLALLALLVAWASYTAAREPHRWL